MEMEKVIKALENAEEISDGTLIMSDQFRDVLIALLKEQQQQIWEFQDQVEYLTDKQKGQEEREKAICKEICDFIRGACSTDTDDDKDFVCYEIQKYFKRSVK